MQKGQVLALGVLFSIILLAMSVGDISATYVYVTVEIDNITAECADGETGGHDIGGGYAGFPAAFRSNTNIPISVEVRDLQGNLLNEQKNYTTPGLWGGNNFPCDDGIWGLDLPCDTGQSFNITSLTCNSLPCVDNATSPTGDTLITALADLTSGEYYNVWIDVQQARVFAENETYGYSDDLGENGYDFGCGGGTVSDSTALAPTSYHCDATQAATGHGGMSNECDASGDAGTSHNMGNVNISDTLFPLIRLDASESGVAGVDWNEAGNGIFKVNFTFT